MWFRSFIGPSVGNNVMQLCEYSEKRSSMIIVSGSGTVPISIDRAGLQTIPSLGIIPTPQNPFRLRWDHDKELVWMQWFGSFGNGDFVEVYECWNASPSQAETVTPGGIILPHPAAQSMLQAIRGNGNVLHAEQNGGKSGIGASDWY